MNFKCQSCMSTTAKEVQTTSAGCIQANHASVNARCLAAVLYMLTGVDQEMNEYLLADT